MMLGRVLVLFGLLSTACGYSLREQSIRSTIPASFRDHNSGIVVNPTDVDVKDAIALGQMSKDGQTLQYTYLAKAERADATYVEVATPLYLIANHARDQAREYRDINPEFVACARNLRAVQLAVSEQFTSSATFRQYRFDRRLILLRDGVRVEPVSMVRACLGRNPFQDATVKQANEIVAKAVAAGAQARKSMYANMPEPQKKQIVEYYRSTGWTNQQIADYTGIVVAPEAEGSATKAAVQETVPAAETDAIFSADELNRPGHYEIVFRTPQSNQLLYRGDDEVRFPISFARFR